MFFKKKDLPEESELIIGVVKKVLPHSVFVNEDNLVELPTIEIFYRKFNGNGIFECKAINWTNTCFPHLKKAA